MSHAENTDDDVAARDARAAATAGAARPAVAAPAEADAAGTSGEQSEASGEQFALGAGLAGGAVVFFLLMRVLVVAHWNWTVAGIVADSMNFTDALAVVMGTLFAEPEMTAVAAMVLAPLAVVDLIWFVTSKRRGVSLRLLFAAFLVFVIAALIRSEHYWWLPVGAIGIGVALAAMRVAWKRGLRLRAIRGLLRATGTVSFLVVLGLSVAIDTPWMVREHIETRPGPDGTSAVIDGYVVDTPPGFVKILTEEPREVVVLNTADVLSRTIIG